MLEPRQTAHEAALHTYHHRAQVFFLLVKVEEFIVYSLAQFSKVAPPMALRTDTRTFVPTLTMTPSSTAR